MSLADLEVSNDHRIVTATVKGEIDMSNARELSSAITSATPNDALGVALDLTSVAYLDSAGIHLLYGLRDSLRSRGQALRLVIPWDSPVNDALRLAGVEGQIGVAATREDALRALRQR